MYHIQKLDPQKWQDSPVLSQYVENLFHRPYCTNQKGWCERLSRSNAIKCSYIQPNQPALVTYIVLDIDHPNGIHQALRETELPPPHLIVQNTENAHVHLVYKLSNPVYMWGKAKSAPIRYLARIQRGMVRELGADASYGGNLMKNPISETWRTYTTNAPQEGYSLKNLAQFVNLDDVATAANDEGFARNCTLFDKLRQYGYKCPSSIYSVLIEHLTPIASDINSEFPEPLFQNEVNHIIRSIARYCSRRDFTDSHKEFSKLQTKRITMRWGDNTEKKLQAQILAAEGVKIGVIAEQLGVTARTLTRWGIRKKK